jgi:hypothetical protein
MADPTIYSSSNTTNELESAEHLLNSDKKLTPEMISSLLNVDVAEKLSTVIEKDTHREMVMRVASSVLTVVLAVLFALGAGAWLMHAHAIGPFGDVMEAAVWSR